MLSQSFYDSKLLKIQFSKTNTYTCSESCNPHLFMVLMKTGTFCSFALQRSVIGKKRKKKLAPLSRPIRSKTKTNHNLLARVFPRSAPVTVYLLRLLIGSFGCYSAFQMGVVKPENQSDYASQSQQTQVTQ